MANRSGLLEKESAAFAEEKPSIRPNHSSLSQTAVISAKWPEMDELLEETLISIRPVEPLTKREVEILKLIVAGKTNKKIAQKIYRSERTVEYHRNRLMHKIAAKTAADLVKRAIAMGIV